VRVIRRLFLYPDSAGALALLGGFFAATAVGLVALGNPPATGLCASCFMVNVAGALGLHGSAAKSFLRPELPAVALGAFFAAAGTREFKVRGGSSPLFRLAGGVFLILACEVFIGCPIKALLRAAGGGAAAAAGLAGLFAGTFLGSAFLADGFAPAPPRPLPEAAGLVLPGAAFFLLLAGSGSGLLFAAASPEGAQVHHAPFAASALAGLFFGAVGQRSRFCVTGSVRTALLSGDLRELAGTGAFLGVAFLLNLASGDFFPTVAFEPGAHADLAWAFLAMAVVGFGAILLSGCPFRQIVTAASGDLDAVAGVAGMMAGAALSVRLGIGSSPAGVTAAGKFAVLAGAVFFLAAALLKRRREAPRAAQGAGSLEGRAAAPPEEVGP